MTPPDAAAADLAAVLRHSRRWLLTTGLLAALLLAGTVAGTALARRHASTHPQALAVTLLLDRPVTTPSGSPLRHPELLRPSVRPEHVPAAPGVFDPAHGAAR